MKLKQVCGSLKKCSQFDDFHVALFLARTSCISIWSWRDIIVLDSPNIEHGHRTWTPTMRLPEFKMAGWKSEVEIIFDRKEIATRF